MATAFGVSGDFIDSELSRFISSGRLPAVIDKVHGIVETRRPDHKNAQYTKIIKEGDVLLSKLTFSTAIRTLGFCFQQTDCLPSLLVFFYALRLTRLVAEALTHRLVD